jgi:hypothetical protein
MPMLRGQKGGVTKTNRCPQLLTISMMLDRIANEDNCGRNRPVTRPNNSQHVPTPRTSPMPKSNP